MKAWESVRKITDEAVPRRLAEDEQTWDAMNEVEAQVDFMLRLYWDSHVPGSYAPESLMLASIQAVENQGKLVENGMDLYEEGLAAFEAEDMVALHRVTAKLKYKVNTAKKDMAHSYWRSAYYDNFTQFAEDSSFPISMDCDVSTDRFLDQTYGGWMAQIIGAAYGTALEGYTTVQLEKAFGDLDEYVREPNTMNDDITYELAFLNAFDHSGYQVTSKEIAAEWMALVPAGWSAEQIALDNIRMGIMPPESGRLYNPFNEWIGAQMRGAICGMAAPGNPKLAAELAWKDGEISHINNGIIGEVFNAMLVAMAYERQDLRVMLREVIEGLPKESEYTRIVQFAFNQCNMHEDWRVAWKLCEEKVKRYNWIHAYPNAAAEVIALWYGNGDFNETIVLSGKMGQDVDCNAAQILSVLGVMNGISEIPERWRKPFANDELETYVRSMKKMTIRSLTDWTVKAVRKAKEEAENRDGREEAK
ncbi:hypothetical protein SANA_11380 [Gottschalkiaceae bacterium SANA]|nr:hypothetical protein SANA_11380 [Gottschalkiaceae bacterium SANA]